MAQRLNRDDSMRRKTPPGDKEEGSAQAGKEGRACTEGLRELWGLQAVP